MPESANSPAQPSLLLSYYSRFHPDRRKEATPPLIARLGVTNSAFTRTIPRVFNQSIHGRNKRDGERQANKRKDKRVTKNMVQNAVTGPSANSIRYVFMASPKVTDFAPTFW